MNTVIVTLRIDKEMKKELVMLALKDNRSLNNYINYILIRYLKERKNN